MSAAAAVRAAVEAGCRLSADGNELVVGGPRTVPSQVLADLREHKASILCWIGLHPQLQRALVRPLWGGKHFLLDTTVKSTVPLVDQCTELSRTPGAQQSPCWAD